MITVIFSIGCTQLKHYDGPTQAKENTALLKTTVSWLAVTEASVEFRKVDGKTIRRYTGSIELLPGVHKLALVCYWYQGEVLMPHYTGLTVTLLPGQAYRVYSIHHSSGCDVKVEAALGGR